MENHFKHLYWFCVAVFFLSFIGMFILIYITFPTHSRDMANNFQGFLQGSLMMSAIGFLLTGNINSSLKKTMPDSPQSIEMNLTATSTPETKDESKQQDF